MCAMAFDIIAHACKSGICTYSAEDSRKLSYLNKVLSPVNNYAITYDLLQYQYDRWLFKTITRAVQESFLAPGNGSNFIASMAFHPSFLPSVRTNGLFCGHPLKRKPGLACGPTDLPVLETFHFTHKFGYFTGGKTNRWHCHLFGNRQEPRRQKCDHLLYYFEF